MTRTSPEIVDSTAYASYSKTHVSGENNIKSSQKSNPINAVAHADKDDWLLYSDSETDQHKPINHKNRKLLPGQIISVNSVMGGRDDEGEWTLCPRTLDLGDVYYRPDKRKCGSRDDAVVHDCSLADVCAHVHRGVGRNSSNQTNDNNNTRQNDAVGAHFAGITNNSGEIMTFCVCFQPQKPTDPRVFSVSGEDTCHGEESSEHLVSCVRVCM